MIDVHYAAKALNGRKTGPNRIQCPGPSGDKKSTSLVVWLDDKHPEGFSVSSFSGRSFQECRDYVRPLLGLPEWTPDRIQPAQPIFEAEEHIYKTLDGDDHHKVVILSDKSVRHYWYDLDSWVKGQPDLLIPYNIQDVAKYDTVWMVEGEANADLINDGFDEVATTFPSGITDEPDASFLYQLQGKDIRLLHVGGGRSQRFVDKFAAALNTTIWTLPDGVTLRQFAKQEGASLSAAIELSDFSEKIVGEETPAPSRIAATPFVWADALEIPTRPKLYGDHLFRKFVSLLVSPGGLGKSSLITVEAIAMASGQAVLKDDKCHLPEPLTVWYWNGEDPQEETQRRVVAAAKHHGITPSDIGNRLYTDTGREQSIMLGQIARGEITLDESLFEDLEAEITARGIDVFILDPFVSSHRMGENDNNAIDAIVKRLAKLADRCNCAVEIVHHVRKPSAGSKEATDVNDARGASALLGAVRAARVLNVLPLDLCEPAGIEPNERFSYFSVTNGKSNMTKRSGDLKWRHLYDFDLCNGPVGESDHVGVVEQFKMPEAYSNLPVDAVEIVQAAARASDMGRLSSKSPDWFGHMVANRLGFDAEDKEQKEALRKLIAKWIENGVLEIRQGEDRTRQIRDFITVAKSHAEPAHDASESLDDSPF